MYLVIYCTSGERVWKRIPCPFFAAKRGTSKEEVGVKYALALAHATLTPPLLSTWRTRSLDKYNGIRFPVGLTASTVSRLLWPVGLFFPSALSLRRSASMCFEMRTKKEEGINNEGILTAETLVFLKRSGCESETSRGEHFQLMIHYRVVYFSYFHCLLGDLLIGPQQTKNFFKVSLKFVTMKKVWKTHKNSVTHIVDASINDLSSHAAPHS